MADIDLATAIDQISGKINETEEGILLGALAKTLAAVQANPTKAAMDSYNGAKKAHDAYQAGKTKDSTWPESLPNLRAVASYLVEKGWKVSESTVYAHKEEGKIAPDGEGRYPVSRVMDYAKVHLERKDGGGESDLDALALRRAIAETQSKEAKAETDQIELARTRGQVADWGRVQLELAARAATLRADFRNLVHVLAPEIARLTGAGPAQIPAIISLLERSHAAYFDAYAQEKTFIAEVSRV